MTPEDLSELALSALREVEGEASFDPSSLTVLGERLAQVPPGKPFHAAVVELCAFAVFLEQKGAKPASHQLLALVNQVCGPEAQRLRQEHVEEADQKSAEVGRRFSEFLGPGGAPVKSSGDKLDQGKLPRKIRG